ncbi:MAG: alanine racemase [bacterium]|nr:alanine racemase [bacterium]
MQVNRRQWLQLAGGVAVAGVLPSVACGSSDPTVSTVAEPVLDTANAWIDVNLQRLALNLENVKKHVRGKKVMAVVKANAYGHGLPQVGVYLADNGADALMVVDLAEAMSLRDAGVEIMILNFGAVPEQNFPTLIENGISQAVFSDEIEGLSAAALRLGKKARVHLHVDTGLGRLGVPFRDARTYVKRLAKLDGLEIQGVMTTLAEHGDFDRLQVQRLEELWSWAQEHEIDLGLRHAVSTGGLLAAGEELWLDMVRPGLLLYGFYGSPEETKKRTIDVQPAISLKARVAYVKTIEAGESVSYHRTFVADQDTTVATLPIGYSNGYPRALVDKGEVLIREKRHPLLSLVTMNHCQARIDGGSVEVGDEAVLVGHQGDAVLPLMEVAEKAGLSAYQLLTRFNPLMPRRYVRGPMMSD